MDPKIKEELNEILKWILEHRHVEEAMNDIAYTAYPHTTKYKSHNRYVETQGEDITISGLDEE